MSATRVWRRTVVAALFAGVCVSGIRVPARAILSKPDRTVLVAYLTALERGNFTAAFARLSDDERRYFRSPGNLAAVFATDRLAIEHFTILESTSGGSAGTLVVVRERVRFFDHAHERIGTVDANVRYGVVPSAHGPAIKDPFHPWYALAPSDVTTSANGVSATVRTISFYAGRLDVLVTFENRSEATVTLLPYGRTVVRDDTGLVHTAIRSKLVGLTDKALYEGLRLPPSGEYTGTMTFFTANRFVPKRLEITFAPVLADGADAPFELALPAVRVPPPT